jgi:hypothetical protein
MEMSTETAKIVSSLLNDVVGTKVTRQGLTHINERIIIDITGTVNKFPEEMYTPTVSIPLKATLALALKKAGFQRENIIKILVATMQEALTLDESAVKSMEKLVGESEAKVKEIVGKLPKQTRAGKTTVKINHYDITVETKQNSDTIETSELSQTLGE